MTVHAEHHTNYDGTCSTHHGTRLTHESSSHIHDGERHKYDDTRLIRDVMVHIYFLVTLTLCNHRINKAKANRLLLGELVP